MNPFRIFLLLFFSFMLVSGTGIAQNVNWKQLRSENKHLIFVGTGYQYGSVYTAGYGYQLNLPHLVLLSAGFSAPFGNKALDDFKVTLGGQSEVLRLGDFSAGIRLNGVFRRYESDYTGLSNFGAETGAVFGFYKSKWYVAADVVFDKAIATYVNHGALMEENNPSVRDGWYVPTGGNLLYGIQSGFSFGQNDLNLSFGKIVSKDFKTSPAIPMYVQVGYNRRI